MFGQPIIRQTSRPSPVAAKGSVYDSLQMFVIPDKPGESRAQIRNRRKL